MVQQALPRSTVSSFPKQSPRIYPSFQFLSILICGQPRHQSRQFSKFYFFESFSRQCQLMVSRCHSLSDSKSPQISRALLVILADLSNAIIWMVSLCPLISKFFNSSSNPLVTVPGAPITIGITVTFMFPTFFFDSLARSRYLSFF